MRKPNPESQHCIAPGWPLLAIVMRSGSSGRYGFVLEGQFALAGREERHLIPLTNPKGLIEKS